MSLSPFFFSFRFNYYFCPKFLSFFFIFFHFSFPFSSCSRYITIPIPLPLPVPVPIAFIVKHLNMGAINRFILFMLNSLYFHYISFCIGCRVHQLGCFEGDTGHLRTRVFYPAHLCLCLGDRFLIESVLWLTTLFGLKFSLSNIEALAKRKIFSRTINSRSAPLYYRIMYGLCLRYLKRHGGYQSFSRRF